MLRDLLSGISLSDMFIAARDLIAVSLFIFAILAWSGAISVGAFAGA